MDRRREWTIKAIAAIAWIAVMVVAGAQFYEHRNFKEPVVLSDGVTKVASLSDYFPAINGTAADCNIYFLDSGVPGGTVLVLGGTHPEEPAGVLSALHFVENAKVRQGRLIVAIHANRSASTVTRPGDAYPQFYRIPTSWGERKFRMGDRWANPLDSWPDPEVFVHYPSRQLLAYMDVRNLNRTWPGRANGLISEQACYAFTELIKAEKVDMVIDLHEAELEYPVISTIVANQNGADIAAMTSMMLTSMEFPIGMEFSPVNLHGLAHREIGDFTGAMSYVVESPEPFLDRVRGITDERLLLTGKDPFVMKAGSHGLLYEKIDESGWPIDVRVGRHNSTVLELVNTMSMTYPDKTVVIEGVPRYAEVVANGVGGYLVDPSQVPADRVVYE